MKAPTQHLATVLVTGAAGFVGSHLVDHLLPEGWRVIGLDNFDTGYDPTLKHRNIQQHVKHAGYVFIEADVRDARELARKIKADIQIVVHVAGQPDERTARPVAPLSQQLDVGQVDLGGTLNLMELCRQRRVRQFVQVSCGSVYGHAGGLPWTEDTIPRPASTTAAAKLASEQFGHCYSRLFGLQFVSLRLFNVYGPRQPPGSLLLSLCAAALSGSALQLPGDAEARRDFTHVSDAVRALRLAMSFGAAPSGVFNVGSGEAVSMSDLVKELELATASPTRVRRIARGEGDLLDCWADIRRAREVLGYVPRVRLREGLRSLVEWYVGTSGLGSNSLPRPRSSGSGCGGRGGERR